MSKLADARILFKMLRGMPAGDDIASRLEGFYQGQAESYDAFRERLLHGRRELMQALQLPANARVVELGGGTGQNLDFLGDKLDQIAAYQVVDLCPSLLAVAQKRAQQYPQVRVVEADACTYQPTEKVDCVIFSYSLTMIPDWAAAIDNAKAMLKPTGKIAVVDFTLSDQQPAWMGYFWRRWFAHDGVHLNKAHRTYLQTQFPQGHCQLQTAKVPYLPLIKVPYYLFTS